MPYFGDFKITSRYGAPWEYKDYGGYTTANGTTITGNGATGRPIYGSCCEKKSVTIEVDTAPGGGEVGEPYVLYSWEAKLECICNLEFGLDPDHGLRVYYNTTTCPKDVEGVLRRVGSSNTTFSWVDRTYKKCCYGCIPDSIMDAAVNPDVADESMSRCECEKKHGNVQNSGTTTTPFAGLEVMEQYLQMLTRRQSGRLGSCRDCG